MQIKINKLLRTICIITCCVFSAICAFSQGVWTQKANFSGASRSFAVGFSIGCKGYIGTGYKNGTFYKDFWEWDQATNIWTQKASFGGTPRYAATGFSIGNKGYIGTGSQGIFNFTKDFWEWDQNTNTWTQKSDFGGTPRQVPVGFSIGNKGYIGTGWDGGHTQDFWEWDQATDTWTQMANFGGTARQAPVAFSIGTKGYIGTGEDGAYIADFWEWDQGTNTWTQKASFGGTGRYEAVGFSIGNKGYIGTGQDGNNMNQDFWEWDQNTNTWTQKANFGGVVRQSAVGFSIGNKGYIGTGRGGAVAPLYQDFWEYYDAVNNSGTTVTVSSQTNVSCNGGNDGSATISATGSFPTYNYLWLPSGGTAATATGLTAGTYTVLITHPNLCSNITQTVTITQPSVITSTISNVVNTPCNGQCAGSAMISATGGITAYTYNWNTAPVQTTPTATGLCAGNYTATISDLNGCSSAQTIVITEPLSLLALTTITPTPCNSNTGMAAVNPSGGTPAYTYAWNNGQTDQTANMLEAGNYIVTITDANGCTNSANIVITETPCPCPAHKLTLPNAFSPNNDGENDEFCLPAAGASADCIKEFKLIIYNRWGERVYEYGNSSLSLGGTGFCWDGFYKDKPQDPAVFAYYLEVTTIDNAKTTKKGNISLVR